MAVPTAPAFHVSEQDRGVTLLEVDGSVADAGVIRWQALLDGALKPGTTRIVFDLRGCGALEPDCLSALRDAAETLRDCGGGVAIVTQEGSTLARQLHDQAADLPEYVSVQQTLLAWRAAQ